VVRKICFLKDLNLLLKTRRGKVERMRNVIGKKHSMLPTIQMAEVQRENSRDKAFAELEELFSATANIDAIKIFYAAKNGINNSTQTIKDLDLTQKKYYTNLKRLIDTGLIERDGGAYRHTTLGKIGFRLAEVLTNAISQKDRLDLVDRLSKAKNITIDETEEIMRAILKDTNIVPGERIADVLAPVRMADTWEKVVNDVIEYIQKAKESIFFATPYSDAKTIQVTAEAALRGVKMKFLSGNKDSVSTNIHLIGKIMTNPRVIKTLLEFTISENFQIKYIELPYTFLVIDRKYSMVEVTRPYTKAFNVAFFFHNATLSERLIETFELLWEKASPMNSFIDRFKKI